MLYFLPNDKIQNLVIVKCIGLINQGIIFISILLDCLYRPNKKQTLPYDKIFTYFLSCFYNLKYDNYKGGVLVKVCLISSREFEIREDIKIIINHEKYFYFNNSSYHNNSYIFFVHIFCSRYCKFYLWFIG